MRGWRRLVSAFVLTALAALGVAERAALHAHPLDENDLVPHEIVLVEGGDSCGSRPHFDAGSLAGHPVCVECVLAAAGVAVGPTAAAHAAVDTPRRLRPLPLAERPASAEARAAGARGPPLS